MLALSGSLRAFINSDPARRMRCGPHRATRSNLIRIGMSPKTTALAIVLDCSSCSARSTLAKANVSLQSEFQLLTSAFGLGKAHPDSEQAHGFAAASPCFIQ